MIATLSDAAASVTTGLVSRAIRDAAEAREGEFIGIVDKDILCASTNRNDAAEKLSVQLVEEGADILILFRGADVPTEQAQALQATLESRFPLTEVILLDGGQPVYDYILVKC